MLNAFRHHRFLHAWSLSVRVLQVVLNAFRHHRFLHISSFALSPRFLMCAQRLSASSIPAPFRFRRFGARGRVLNAFRHHRFLHGPGFRCSPYGIAVLNAFRHHRFLHLMVVLQCVSRSAQRLSASSIPAHGGRPADRAVWCSTPFGIIDSCTARRVADVVVTVPVLNAFRHHRFLHTRGG